MICTYIDNYKHVSKYICICIFLIFNITFILYMLNIIIIIY